MQQNKKEEGMWCENCGSKVFLNYSDACTTLCSNCAESEDGKNLIKQRLTEAKRSMVCEPKEKEQMTENAHEEAFKQFLYGALWFLGGFLMVWGATQGRSTPGGGALLLGALVFGLSRIVGGIKLLRQKNNVINTHVW
ncbi:MAG: hypothetical protein ACE5HO_13620 [bacterium]